MIILTLQSNVKQEQIDAIASKIADFGLDTNVSQSHIVVKGDMDIVPEACLLALPGVKAVKQVIKSYPLVSRDFQSDDTVIKVNDIPIGGQEIQIIAGPCSVETPEQMQASAQGVAAAGALFMRGGAYKPRTSPYNFQGHGELGLKYLVEAARAYDLPVVTELMDVRDIDKFLEYEVDVIQIGTRNMQNFPLLKEVGKLHIPIFLKRGMSATMKDLLMAAEYIAANGNTNIVLVERGIRTYETAYRNTLDISAIPFLKHETHLPVIVDPSHAGGKSWMVPELSYAAIAAGADGLLIESHPHPAKAWSDKEQALTNQELAKLIDELKLVARSRGRKLGEKQQTAELLAA